MENYVRKGIIRKELILAMVKRGSMPSDIYWGPLASQPHPIWERKLSANPYC